MPNETLQSKTKAKLDALIRTYPAGVEHTEPTREMLTVASYACNGAENKIQALTDAVGQVAYFLAMVHRGEPDRIAEAINNAVEQAIKEHVTTCSVLHPTVAGSPESSAELSILGSKFSGRGKAANYFTAGLGIAVGMSLLMGAMLYIQSSRFADMVDRRFAAAERRSLDNDERAVSRAVDIRNAIGRDAADKE